MATTSVASASRLCFADLFTFLPQPESTRGGTIRAVVATGRDFRSGSRAKRNLRGRPSHVPNSGL